MAQPSDALIAEISQYLDVDHQYVTTLPAWDQERITEVRSAGRAAARRLGWKVRTFQRPVGDERIRVFIVITESTPEEDERLRDRATVLMDEAFKKFF